MTRTLNPMTSAVALPMAETTEAAGLIFTSGQLPRRADGSVAEDFGEQVTQVLDNLEAALMRAGSSLAGLLKITVYLASLDDFDRYNAIYRERLEPAGFPARTTVEVCRFRDASRLEIDAIAVPTPADARAH